MINIKKIRRLLGLMNRKIQYLIGSYKGNLVKAYWFNSVPNFGDLITPELFKYYGFTPINTPRNEAQILSIGSILDNVLENYSGTIFGSGLMHDRSKSFPQANIVAVRGKLTKERINASDTVILGDPGLLADRLINKRQKKLFTLGIVLHYADYGDKRIEKIFQNHPKEILIIDVRRNPIAVINDIDKCNHILSSSLHGIITADSLGIPNAWIYLSDKVLGNGFKFHDYSSAFNQDIEPQIVNGSENLIDLIYLTHTVSSEISVVKNNLDFAFSNLQNLNFENKK